MKTPGTTTIAESHGWGVSPPFLLLQFSDSTLQNSHLASRLCSCGPRSAQLRSPLATALLPALPQNAADTRQSFGNGVAGGRWDSQHLGRSQARSLRTVHVSPGLRAQLRLCGSLVISSPSSVFPSSYTLARTSDTPYSYSLTLKNLALLLQVTLQGVLTVPKEPIDLFPYKKE